MNSTTTRQMQPETLDALNNFITRWNEDPTSLNATLLITGNQFSIINEEVLRTQPTIENLQSDNNLEIPLLTESDSFEQLFARIDFDTNYPSEGIAEVINPSPENIASANIFNLETEQEDSPLATLISTQDNIIRKIKEDFTTDHVDPLIRVSPFSPSLLDEQMNEIIIRLQNGTRTKNRDKQIRTLEACYYLETLRIAHCNNFLKLKEINQTLRNKLGQRKANNVSITAE